MSTNAFGNIFVVIRSVGERTESACAAAILSQGTRPQDIATINETPFSQALRRSYQSGLDSGRQWTFCIDADVVLRHGAMATLMEHAERLPPATLGLQGMMLDKFTCSIRGGGVHIYRTNWLGEALSAIPAEGSSLRPETSVLHAMRDLGHAWSTVPYVSGIHDFGQYHLDIFRKCYVHANKHLLHLPRLLPIWRRMALCDPDFAVAIEGAAWGLRESGAVLIDKYAISLAEGWSRVGIPEKQNATANEFSPDAVEDILRTWAPDDVQVHGFPWSRDTVIAFDGATRFGAIQRISRSFAGKSRKLDLVGSSIFAFGSALERAGKWVKRWPKARQRES